MLESFLHAGTKMNLPFRALALTRNAWHFANYLPHIASDSRVELIESDVATMPIPEGPVDYVVHSLFSPAALPEMEKHFELATRKLLEIAAEKGACGGILCSTGAVYKPAVNRTPISETWPRFGAGDPLSYARIRSQVEDQWAAGCSKRGMPGMIARGFAFVGPRLPLGGQFAVGNFLGDLLLGRRINVRGDGTPIRSYLYAADLAARLWLLLLCGQSGTCNVGNDCSLTIQEAAQAVAELVCPPAGIELLREDPTFSYYVPDTAWIDQAFGLADPIAFTDALARTWRWLQEPMRTER